MKQINIKINKLNPKKVTISNLRQLQKHNQKVEIHNTAESNLSFIATNKKYKSPKQRYLESQNKLLQEIRKWNPKTQTQPELKDWI